VNSRTTLKTAILPRVPCTACTELRTNSPAALSNINEREIWPITKNGAAPVRLKVSAVADLQACEQVPSGEVSGRAKPERNRTQQAESDRGEKHARVRPGRVHQIDRCQPRHGTHSAPVLQ
jgi:hypothetical protein